MPKRIPFHVVYATSEDSSYPACELNAQGPAARGWRSEGTPPHELLLRLARVTSVHKLQLLAHHQLIPSSVEVLVSGGLVSEGAATPCGATYTSVGKVTLARPAQQARTRELRSAALPEPTIARFVKLKLSGPHPPAKEDDQVALMAVNVLGEEVEDTEAPPAQPVSKEPAYSPYDDLAFIMYVDNDIADLVRMLDEKKKVAVSEERFEYARRLKSAGAALASAGIRIGRWRLRKRTAAARDDFELARRMRDRIADALCGVKEDPQLCRLFEEDGPDRRNDSSMPQEYDFSHHLSPSVAAGSLSMDIPSPVPPIEQEREENEIQEPEYVNGEEEEEDVQDMQPSPEPTLQEEVPPSYPEPVQQPVQMMPEENKEVQKIEEEELRKETDSPRRSITPNAANGSVVRRRNKSAGPRSTFEAYEERLLPALRHSHTNEYLREAREEECSGGSAATSHSRTAPPHKLNDRERKHAALPILIFGYPLVEKFFSKNYLDKEEGLSRLRAELTSPSNGSTKTSPNKTARAAAILLQRALRDKVFSVYSQANEVVKVLFKEFVPDRVCAAEVGRCLEKLLPELLRACGDPAPRVHSTAQHTVLTVADCPQVRSLHLIPQQLVRPVAASMHPRLALSRLQMLEQLILSHGISTDKNSGLTVRRLAECGAAGAQHAAGSVRAAAERILLAAYARSPRVVRAQLPPDDAVTRRNLIYRHLFQQFDRIDMQKMLNQAPTEEQLLNGNDQSMADSTLETASVTQSTRSGTTVSGMTASLGMTSSIGATSSYSLKSMTSSASGATLAPSSISGSYTTSKTKSSLKKSPTKRYTPRSTAKDFSNYPGYNKLRLDSAVSPKHSPRSAASGGVEKVHFQESHSQSQSLSEQVVYRRTNRNSENRHSMIHYDHEPSKPQLKERPVTVYEPLHLDYRDSPTLGSPKTSKNDLRSMDSLPMDSPQMSRNDLRCDSDCRSLDSPKVKADYFRDGVLESPKLVAGLRNLHLDEHSQMDESGYYSPGRRHQAAGSEHQYEPYDVGNADVSENIPETISLHTTCSWCGRRVRAEALEAHYWRRCVLLARCPHCRVALEARMLHAHLLEECTMSEGSWKACHKCGAALRTDDSDYHANCIPLGMDEWKCPYCFTNVLARDLPWQRHLMQCPRNPRTTQSS
ncbi:centrosomal protein of 104 kDa [Spodoptera litura]|uniref:Centrosomal protein of 104 kDa n=1 Tax=Spodoptera litura TaxID=69820 RepID=A0A9J7DYT2_SPOLT|nr:centrosomal protein of 104 kDa [Spodoptera litura]